MAPSLRLLAAFVVVFAATWHDVPVASALRRTRRSERGVVTPPLSFAGDAPNATGNWRGEFSEAFAEERRRRLKALSSDLAVAMTYLACTFLLVCLYAFGFHPNSTIVGFSWDVVWRVACISQAVNICLCTTRLAHLFLKGEYKLYCIACVACLFALLFRVGMILSLFLRGATTVWKGATSSASQHCVRYNVLACKIWGGVMAYTMGFSMVMLLTEIQHNLFKSGYSLSVQLLLLLTVLCALLAYLLFSKFNRVNADELGGDVVLMEVFDECEIDQAVLVLGAGCANCVQLVFGSNAVRFEDFRIVVQGHLDRAHLIGSLVIVIVAGLLFACWVNTHHGRIVKGLEKEETSFVHEFLWNSWLPWATCIFVAKFLPVFSFWMTFAWLQSSTDQFCKSFWHLAPESAETLMTHAFVCTCILFTVFVIADPLSSLFTPTWDFSMRCVMTAFGLTTGLPWQRVVDRGVQVCVQKLAERYSWGQDAQHFGDIAGLSIATGFALPPLIWLLTPLVLVHGGRTALSRNPGRPSRRPRPCQASEEAFLQNFR